MTTGVPPATQPSPAVPTQAISGSAAKLKPWHYAVMAGVCLGCIMLIPTLNGLVSKKKADDTTAAVLAGTAGSVGEAWQPAAFPAPQATKVADRPIMENPSPPAAAPHPTQSLLTQATAMAKPSGPTDQRMFGQRQMQPPPEAPQGGGGTLASGGPVRQAAAGGADGGMATLLKPTELGGYSATRIRNPWATIEQGRIIACNSVTPMTSELAGFVKAKITRDVRSVDGTTILIDRDSTVFGEIAHGLTAGQDRLFVLWRYVWTPAPDFVKITLNSPAADELGESGLPGDINDHKWKRIGGALMLSGIDSLLQGAGSGIGAALSHGNGSGNGGNGSNLNFYQFQGQGSSLASSLLSHTVEIPDTLHRDQALPCSIFVAGDLDFSSIYQLRRR